MSNFFQQWKFCWLLVVLASCNFHQVIFGLSRDDGSIGRIESTADVVNPTPETTESRSRTSPVEREQRFCLNRLREALKSVCAGSERTPHYFNPTQIFVLNQTSLLQAGAQGRSKNLRNDIPTMGEPRRRLLRKRSRRNIVRECCDKPCNYSNLRKYCSPSVRLSPSLLESSMYFEHPTARNGRLSRNLNPAANKVGIAKPSCYPECNTIESDSPSDSPSLSPGQCVSVADLEKFYLKFLRKQWTKNGEQSLGSSSNIYGDGFEGVETPAAHLEEMLANAYAVATNRMVTSSYIDRNNQELNLTPTVWQQPNKPTEKSEDNGEKNEIDKVTEPVMPTKWSSNAITAKPIIDYISLPRGTNDYFY